MRRVTQSLSRLRLDAQDGQSLRYWLPLGCVLIGVTMLWGLAPALIIGGAAYLLPQLVRRWL